LLSGGLDSSYVLARAVEAEPKATALHAFARDSKAMDERSHARAAAGHVGVPLTEIEIDDCWSFSSRLLPDAAFDQPNVPMQAALLSRLAETASAAGTRVLLDGAGGDEVMGGRGSYLADLLLAGRLGLSLQEARAWANRAGLSTRRVWFRGAVLPLVPNGLRERYRTVRNRRSPSPLPPWIDMLALKATGLGAALATPTATSVWSRTQQFQSFWSYLVSEVQPVFAWRERWASLPNQLEARSPFWDLRVVELCRQMPSWVHRKAGENRALLREAMKPRLPAQIVERQDQGVFDEFVEVGLYEERSARVGEGITALSSLLYLDSELLRNQLDGFGQAPMLWRHGLCRAISAGLWLSRNSYQWTGRTNTSSLAAAMTLDEDRTSAETALAEVSA
jgi:asparagine synthase (glutamine-hydrolysing)